MSDFGLFFSFEEQSESFTLGFEAGMLYQKMSVQKRVESTIHTKNLSQVKTMAVKMGFTLNIQPTTLEEWTYIELVKNVMKRIK